jgi:energy-coupling factor transporter ATP-binding protein EcfA2
MGTFVDMFRDRFQGEPQLDGWVEALSPHEGVEPAYLTLRVVPLLGLTEGVDAGLHALRQFLSAQHDQVAVARHVVEAAATLSNQVLGEESNGAPRIRRLVDLMLSQGNPVLAPLASAFAAVMHARVGDDKLAVLRLEDVMGHLASGNRMGELDTLLTHYLTHLASQRTERVIESPAPVAVSIEGQVQQLLWTWLLGDRPVPASGEPSDIEALLHGLPRGGLEPLTAALPGLVFDAAVATGRGGDLAPLVAPALDLAEQLVWAAERRSVLWSRLAMAWVAIGRTDRAESCLREAREAASREAADLPPERQLTLAADLLEVSIRAGRPAPAVAEAPPAEGAATPFDLRQFDMLAPVLGRGEVVLIAGAALPEARGVESVVELMRGFVRSAEENERMSTSSRSLIAGIEQGQLNQVGSALRAGQFPLDAMVQKAYQARFDNDLYRDLARIPFASVLTLAWDGRLLDAFEHRHPLEIHVGSSAVLDAAKSREFAFTWLAGDPSTEPVAIGMRDVRTRLYGDETLSRYLAGLLGGSPLLFLGMTAAEVVEFLDTVLPFGSSTSAGDDIAEMVRFAVCPVDDLWELSRGQLQTQYGIQLLGYPDGDPTALATVIRHLSAQSSQDGPAAPRPTRAQPALARIALENIGAFERVELRLNEAWNLMLGNNGCGKSTILRAVALGLCGDHPQAVEAGASLLRSGTTHGAIELDIGASRFRTDLTRSGTAVRVRNHSLTPLQQGSWAVLGFPALRGLSVSTGGGITNPQAPEPRVEDLLPLLRGDVDHRMDDIKQWIINIDARSKDAADGQRWTRLLGRFFDVVKELTPGGTLEFDQVDPAAWEVWVRTDDGVVSIDQLSQGMSSIIAWVGNLLQRMYDIYPHSEDPATEPAVVLIDELDAHLHPAWQRLIPSLTRQHFPNVQFLATSHSPLIAGSLRPGELYVARRVAATQADGVDRLVATIRQQDLDPKGLRADQILTSPLFGMMTSRSTDFDEDVARYDKLLTADSRSPSDEREMLRLRVEIADSYRDGETAEEREQQGGTDMDELRAQLSDLDPEKQARLREFVQESSRGSVEVTSEDES